MTKKEAIKKAIYDSDYIGSQRWQIFEQKLNDAGYRIVKKKWKH